MDLNEKIRTLTAVFEANMAILDKMVADEESEENIAKQVEFIRGLIIKSKTLSKQLADEINEKVDVLDRQREADGKYKYLLLIPGLIVLVLIGLFI